MLHPTLGIGAGLMWYWQMMLIYFRPTIVRFTIGRMCECVVHAAKICKLQGSTAKGSTPGRFLNRN
jgi:hypothetical protein